MVLALNTGMRIGEILGLKWEDVDLHRARIYLRRAVWKKKEGTPKSGKARTIPLNEHAVKALVARTPPQGAHVFCRQKDGQQLSYWTCQEMLATVCERARLENVTWHTLRHTFASHLVMENAPIVSVQQLLGHCELKLTMRYAHLSDEANVTSVQSLAMAYNKAQK